MDQICEMSFQTGDAIKCYKWDRLPANGAKYFLKASPAPSHPGQTVPKA